MNESIDRLIVYITYTYIPYPTNTDALIAEIHRDISVSTAALDQAAFKPYGTTLLDWTTTAAPPAEWRPPPPGQEEQDGR